MEHNLFEKDTSLKHNNLVSNECEKWMNNGLMKNQIEYYNVVNLNN